MKKLLYGDIVLLRFPFTDGKKDKKRPALILRDSEDGDIIVCRITSKLYVSEFDFKIDDWKNCGLRLPSCIRLHKIASLDSVLVYQKIGVISTELRELIKGKFANLLR